MARFLLSRLMSAPLAFPKLNVSHVFGGSSGSCGSSGSNSGGGGGGGGDSGDGSGGARNGSTDGIAVGADVDGLRGHGDLLKLRRVLAIILMSASFYGVVVFQG